MLERTEGGKGSLGKLADRLRQSVGRSDWHAFDKAHGLRRSEQNNRRTSPSSFRTTRARRFGPRSSEVREVSGAKAVSGSESTLLWPRLNSVKLESCSNWRARLAREGRAKIECVPETASFTHMRRAQIAQLVVPEVQRV